MYWDEVTGNAVDFSVLPPMSRRSASLGFVKIESRCHDTAAAAGSPKPPTYRQLHPVGRRQLLGDLATRIRGADHQHPARGTADGFR